MGAILLTGDGKSLTGLSVNPFRSNLGRLPLHRRDDSCFALVRKQLDAYFEGRLERFEVPLQFRGTVFQKRVWQALQEIPYGATISYADLAMQIGNRKAFRAVGNANGKNPIAIIVPCHRVIAKDGGIGGYSGGLSTKKLLLRLENAESAVGV